VAFNRKLLNEGEYVVVSTRTHIKALLVPALWLIVVAAAAGYVSSFPRGNAKPLLLAVIWGIALVVLIWLTLKRFLTWLTTSYTVTNRRIITRTGILSRRGHDIPVPRISDVAYEHGIIDRMLGCGTLVISDASERGTVRLPDIPQVEHVQLQISDLLFGHTGGDFREREAHETRTRELPLDDGT
jgi:uncharacterized membrane protein YdbT with pleckstrin-like domain